MFIETVKLVRNYQNNNFDVYPIGRFGWRNCFIANQNAKSEKIKEQITNDVINKLNKIVPIGMQKLSYLGFKKQNAHCFI